MIKDIFSKIKEVKYIGLTDIEKKVKKMTEPEGWGPTGQDKDMLVDSSHIYQNLTEIFGILEGRLSDVSSKYKGHLKALGIIKHLLVHGAKNCVDQAKYLEHTIRSLTTFFYTDENGREIGNGVRQNAKEVLKMIKSEEYLSSVRKEGRRLKSRFQGFSKNEIRWRKEFKNENSFAEDPVDTEYTKEEPKEEPRKPKKSKKSKKKKKVIESSSESEDEDSGVSNVVIRKPKKKKSRKSKKTGKKTSKREKTSKNTIKESSPSQPKIIRRPSFGEESAPTIEKPKKKKETNTANLIDFFDTTETTSAPKVDSFFSEPSPKPKTQTNDFFDDNPKDSSVLAPTKGDSLFEGDSFFDDGFEEKKTTKKESNQSGDTDLLGILSGLGGTVEKKEENSREKKKLTINQMRNRGRKKPATSTITSAPNYGNQGNFNSFF